MFSGFDTPDYQKWIKAIMAKDGGTGGTVGPAIGADQANPANPQEIHNAAMTGDRNTTLTQGLAQTPMIQSNSNPGYISGGLSSLTSGQLQSLVNSNSMLNPDEYQKFISPQSQMNLHGARSALNTQNMSGWDKTQAANWLQQASWINQGVDQTNQQGANWAQLGRALTPPPPDPNAPTGYQIGRAQNYIGQQQKAWSQWGNAEKNRLISQGNLINPEGGGLPVDENGNVINPNQVQQSPGINQISPSENKINPKPSTGVYNFDGGKYKLYDNQSGQFIDIDDDQMSGANLRPIERGPGNTFSQSPDITSGRVLAIPIDNVGSGSAKFFQNAFVTNLGNPSSNGVIGSNGNSSGIQWDGNQYVSPETGLPLGANSTGLNQGTGYLQAMATQGRDSSGDSPIMTALRNANGFGEGAAGRSPAPTTSAIPSKENKRGGNNNSGSYRY